MSQGSVMLLLLSCKQRMFDRWRQTRLLAAHWPSGLQPLGTEWLHYAGLKGRQMLRAGFHSLPRSHCPDVARHTHDGWRHRNVTMTETEILAERFEANRSHLRSVAYRMLGSQTEAD